ncbi:sigma-70 family RNA polymerase sigma factor [Stieleria sp. TO1_6]|uniref:RNA polymerase sigma factor n=1 Tax=Stieleria tagensis TaxID=2956795 RepID=UPI00209AC13B|nr:sigma-70 family RNA polymerase sigma factor [Stieleria tagensis]MCO8123940.1 sigma-70 family RNA polymerase sigma factor [Stieleria tagensis]
MPNDAPLNAQIRQSAREIAAGQSSSERSLALATLYDLTADRLIRFAASITRRQHDAEDVVSAAMVKIASRPKLLVAADRPWHYLLRMVRNEALVILRTRSRWSSIGSIAERLIGRSCDVVESDDQKRQVWKALASLPGAQSEVVVLKIWEQMTFVEIAQVLEITPSTAASRYRYALEKLSCKLGPSHPTRSQSGATLTGSSR